MKSKRKLLVLAALAATAAIVVYVTIRLLPHEPADSIPVSGNIEATEAIVGFKLAGLVADRLVSEGHSIAKDQLVARLDAEDLLQHVRMRQADVHLAQAALDELEAGSREQEIAAAKATMERAATEMEQQKRDWQRQKTLYEKNVISEQEYEKAQTAYDVAQARAREAREQYNLIEAGPRPEKIDQARARLEQAEEALGLAQLNLRYAELKSPMSGVVLADHIEPGEYVAPGTGIVTLADLQNVWLRAYINETDLGRVKLGQRVIVTTDSYPDKQYDGTISFIASEAEFTPKTVQTKEQRVKLVYRIKIDLDNPHGELKPGMPADGTIVLVDQQK